MASDRLTFRLSGEVGLFIEGHRQPLSGRRQREVLALLLIENESELSADRIAYELWSDNPPKTSRNSVQRFLADIRASLGDYSGRLTTGLTGYRLTFERAECDLFRAEDLAIDGLHAIATGRIASGADLLRQALQLQKGTPLGGVGDVEFAIEARRRIDQLRSGWSEELFEADLALGRHLDLISELERFVASNPYRERAQGQLLLALHRAGRRHDVQTAFDQIKSVTSEDLGVDISPELASLHRKIVDRSPELDGPPLTPRPNLDSDGNNPDTFSLPGYLVRASEVPLVGRAAEVNLLTDVLDAAVQGQSGVVLVRGEPGIGKTRLASEIAAISLAHGFNVAYGQSHEGIAFPYEPWLEALSQLAASVSPLLLRDHCAHYGAALSTLVPNLEHLASPDSRQLDADVPAPTAEHPPAGDRQMGLFEAALGLLNATAAENPFLLVLDDLQWADESTIELLDYVAHRMSGSIVIVGTCRNTSVAADASLVELIAKLSPLPSTRIVELVGLALSEIEQLVDLFSGPDAGAISAAAIVTQTKGNPFFASEVIKQLVAVECGQAVASSDAIPEAAQRIIHQRVAKLGSGTAAALQAASVFGRSFELDLLAEVLGNDDFAVLEMMERALADGLVVDSTEGYDRFQFTHDLVRQSLYDELSNGRRSRLHLKIADAIEKSSVRFPDDRAGEITSHLVAVGDPRIGGRICDAARRAALAAAAASAPTEAAKWLTMAIAQLDAQPTDDPLLRAQLLVELGRQQFYSRHPDYRQTLLAAGHLAAQVDDTETLVAACLANSRGTFLNLWEVDREVTGLLKSALAAIPKPQLEQRSRLLANLASEEWDLDHEVITARHVESIELAREAASPEALANALVRFARARGCYLSMDEHRRTNAEIRALVDDNGLSDPTLMNNLAMSERHAALQSADLQAVQESNAGVSAFAERIPIPYAETGARLAHVVEAGIAGDHATFEALASELLAYNLERGDPEAMISFEAHLLYARFIQGRIDELVDEVRRLVAEQPSAEIYQSVLAFIHAETRDFETAQDLLTRAHTKGFGTGRNVFAVQALGYWGETAAGVGDKKACATLFDRLVVFQGEFLGNMTIVSHPADLTLGRLCTTLGRFDDARAFLESSLRIATDFDALHMQARTILYQAVLESAVGTPEVVRELAEAALTIASENGYRAVERDARALLDLD